jgi:hypothetical protein
MGRWISRKLADEDQFFVGEYGLQRATDSRMTIFTPHVKSTATKSREARFTVVSSGAWGLIAILAAPYSTPLASSQYTVHN